MIKESQKQEKYHKTKKRILHIISGDLWAGAEVQTYHTLYAIKQKNTLAVTCVIFNDGILFQKLKGLNIETIIFDETKVNSFVLLVNLIKVIISKKPHLVHVHRIKEHFLAVLAIMFSFHKIPLVRTVHGLSGVCKNLAFKQHLRSSIAVFLDKQLIKYKSDVVIAVSKDLEDHLRTGKVKGEIYQIYNSINTHDYQLTHNRDVIRHKYHVENHFWIGTAVRLVEPKNLGMLIESGRQLLTGEIPFKISIFGDGPLKKELQEHIDAYGLSEKVELHGFERDILPLINAMDVFVLCSEHEGLPMALLEAMFLMTPVVCTAVGGMKEVIEDGLNGILVPPNDVSALTESLRQMYRNKESASKLATNAKATTEEKFSLSVTTKQVFDLYAHCIH